MKSMRELMDTTAPLFESKKLTESKVKLSRRDLDLVKDVLIMWTTYADRDEWEPAGVKAINRLADAVFEKGVNTFSGRALEMLIGILEWSMYENEDEAFAADVESLLDKLYQ